jgi:hypothetical protein
VKKAGELEGGDVRQFTYLYMPKGPLPSGKIKKAGAGALSCSRLSTVQVVTGSLKRAELLYTAVALVRTPAGGVTQYRPQLGGWRAEGRGTAGPASPPPLLLSSSSSSCLGEEPGSSPPMMTMMCHCRLVLRSRAVMINFLSVDSEI